MVPVVSLEGALLAQMFLKMASSEFYGAKAVGAAHQCAQAEFGLVLLKVRVAAFLTATERASSDEG